MVVVVVTKKEQRAGNVLFSECEYTDDYWDQWAEGKQLVGTGRKERNCSSTRRARVEGLQLWTEHINGGQQAGKEVFW